MSSGVAQCRPNAKRSTAVVLARSREVGEDVCHPHAPQQHRARGGNYYEVHAHQQRQQRFKKGAAAADALATQDFW